MTVADIDIRNAFGDFVEVFGQFPNDLNCGWAGFHGKLRGMPTDVTSYINEEGIAPDSLVNATNLIKP